MNGPAKSWLKFGRQPIVDRGYDDRLVKELTDAELAEQALQSAYDSGYYTAKPGDHLYARLGQVAIDRRNACFTEIKRRLEATEALAEALKTFAQHPYLYGGARVAADVMEVYCKLCNAIGEGTLWNIEHADTCPIGQGLAALAEWVEANR